MGAKYDIVYCQFPLPVPKDDDGEIDYNSLVYQTKDFDGNFEEYTIYRKGRVMVGNEKINVSKQVSIYSIHKGCWIEYQISLDHGKVVRVELMSFEGKRF